MAETRVKRLASILVDYSIKVKKGSTIKLNIGPAAADLGLEVYKRLLKKGAIPLVNCSLPGFAYHYYRLASREQLLHFPKIAMYETRNIDGVISIGTEYNTKEFTNISPNKIAARSRVISPIKDAVIKQDNWVFCEYPTEALAQDAEMSLAEFRDFSFSAMLHDWEKESKRQDRLKAIIDRGSSVRIRGKNTDIRFSIKGRKGIKCAGKRNMPDGEVFCGPVESTTEGYIEYSFPAIKNGKEVDGIFLRFSKGKVVEARAKKNQDLLKTMIKIDKGASYLGEFGIGTNYRIKKFIKQILFDEKIGGTIHLALGMAYPEGGGRNKSALHWDMIKDLRHGGEIWIDGKVIQKNGRFTFKL